MHVKPEVKKKKSRKIYSKGTQQWKKGKYKFLMNIRSNYSPLWWVLPHSTALAPTSCFKLWTFRFSSFETSMFHIHPPSPNHKLNYHTNNPHPTAESHVGLGITHKQTNKQSNKLLLYSQLCINRRVKHSTQRSSYRKSCFIKMLVFISDLFYY